MDISAYGIKYMVFYFLFFIEFEWNSSPMKNPSRRDYKFTSSRTRDPVRIVNMSLAISINLCNMFEWLSVSELQ